jgi:hypothetical protein
MGLGDAIEGIFVRFPKVKTGPNFEPARALPEGSCFDLLFAPKLRDAGESTPERGGGAKRYIRITAKAARGLLENTAGIEKLDGRAFVLGAPRGGDRPVIAVGRLLCRTHRRPETAHACTRGARQLPELAEGGARFSRREMGLLDLRPVFCAQEESHAGPGDKSRCNLKTVEFSRALLRKSINLTCTETRNTLYWHAKVERAVD